MRLILLASIAALTLVGCDREPPDNRVRDGKPAVATRTVGERAIQASFDCDRANGQAQELVCGDASLAAMDREVARLAGIAAEPAGQADYALQRDSCWKADELRQCVMATAMLEIHRLRRGSEAARRGAGPSTGPVAFTCKGISGPVLATFVEGDAGAVALEWGAQQIAIDHVTAGSGVKYDGRWDGRQYGLWTKGKDAIFTVADTGDHQCVGPSAG